MSPSFAVCDAVVDYRVLIKAFAASRIESIDPREVRCAIRGRIATLAREPRPATAEPLPGYAERFRIRLDRYRILYQIDDRQKRCYYLLGWISPTLKPCRARARFEAQARPRSALGLNGPSRRLMARWARIASMNGGCAAKCPLISSARLKDCGRGLPRPFRIGCRCATSNGCRSRTRWRWDFGASGKGRSNIYLVLLDYRDSRREAYGVYVGMSKYPPAQRFDQHKAGIRAAGSVLKRGLEVLTGPTMHLQFIRRTEAERIEVELAQALAAAGLIVKGGH